MFCLSYVFVVPFFLEQENKVLAYGYAFKEKHVAAMEWAHTNYPGLLEEYRAFIFNSFILHHGPVAILAQAILDQSIKVASA